MTRFALVLALAALPLVACGGDDEPKKKPFNGSGGSGGSAGGGAGGTAGSGGVAGGGGTAGGGMGGVAGGGTGGGTGGGGTGGGGTGGTGGGTTGPEVCTDNFDNDGDGKADCADTECSAACASACASPTLLADPADTQGTTAGHPDSLNNSCSGSGSGPDVAYEFTASKSGVFEAVWGGFTALSMSVRSACSGAELGCTKTKSLKVPVTAGTKLWVVMDGVGGASGPFGLSVQSRPIACGDKHTDGSEACDDGNTTSGDGCSSTCSIELKESEPNDTATQANTWASPFTASIGSATDVDIVKVVVTKAGSTLSAAVQDFGDSACEQDKIDSYLELWAPDANTVLGADDNGGEGLCSALSKTGLAAGTYYLVISAAAGANPATFSYKLNVTLS